MAARTDQTMNANDSAGSAVVLTVDRLAKSFGGVEAVRDISFAVSAGEIVAMIGPNGAGKTTCFNLVNGQLAPDAGSVMLLGKRIDGLPPRTIARAGVGRTFQIAASCIRRLRARVDIPAVGSSISSSFGALASASASSMRLASPYASVAQP